MPILVSFVPMALSFFFNYAATTEIYTLSLHDALPIYIGRAGSAVPYRGALTATRVHAFPVAAAPVHHALGLVDAQRQSSDAFPAGPDCRCPRMVFPRPRVRARAGRLQRREGVHGDRPAATARADRARRADPRR